MRRVCLWSILPVIAIVARSAYAQTISFEDVWQKVQAQSLSIEARRLQRDAAKAAEERASRHWLPRVYMDVKSYQTNDSGSVFFGVLEQRELKQTDFDPDSLNHPSSHTFTRGSIGVDWPIYEGGLRSSQIESSKLVREAQESAIAQTELEQYARTGFSYGALAVLRRQSQRLQKISKEIEKLLKGYQLGSRSNPVGYSGLLGMKAMANRVKGIELKNRAETENHYARIREIGLGDLTWVPVEIYAGDFLRQHFSNAAEASGSYGAEAAAVLAKAGAEGVRMERAKFRPRVGAFAESFVFNGDRDSEDGYTVGLYLQWNLFDPGRHGSVQEARLKSAAAEVSARASRDFERAEVSTLNQQIRSLDETLKLLIESDEVLGEQARVAAGLFRNGSINALQMVEIMGRRTDLIGSMTDTELALLDAGTQAFAKRKVQVPSIAKTGGNR